MQSATRVLLYIFGYRLLHEKPCWSTVIIYMETMVCGCFKIVKSLPALDPHSLIASLCQEMNITEFSDLIYTKGKASSEHGSENSPEHSKLQI